MRMARCIADAHLQLLGNQASVSIARGWQGDLDQVIGRNADGVRTTVADALGQYLTAETFEMTKSIDKPSSTKTAPAAPAQE